MVAPIKAHGCKVGEFWAQHRKADEFKADEFKVDGLKAGVFMAGVFMGHGHLILGSWLWTEYSPHVK
jgi:hypothetical protein